MEVGADRQWKTVAIFVRRLGFFLLWIASVAPAIGDTEPSGVPQGISALSYFIGTWSCQGVFPSSGKTIASTIRFAADGASLVKHHDDLPPNRYHAIELWGYGVTDRRFNAVIQDSFGGIRDFSSSGWKGNALVWTSWAAMSPSTLRAFLGLLLRARNARAAMLSSDGEPLRWSTVAGFLLIVGGAALVFVGRG